MAKDVALVLAVAAPVLAEVAAVVFPVPYLDLDDVEFEPSELMVVVLVVEAGVSPTLPFAAAALFVVVLEVLEAEAGVLESKMGNE